MKNEVFLYYFIFFNESTWKCMLKYTLVKTYRNHKHHCLLPITNLQLNAVCGILFIWSGELTMKMRSLMWVRRWERLRGKKYLNTHFSFILKVPVWPQMHSLTSFLSLQDKKRAVWVKQERILYKIFKTLKNYKSISRKKYNQSKSNGVYFSEIILN